MSAPFRIRRKPSTASFQMTEGQGAASEYDDYYGRLLKLVPAEALAFYVVGRGFIPKDADKIVLAVWTLVGVIAVVAVRSKGTRDPKKGESVQWRAVGLATLSFVILMYSMGDAFALYGWHIPYLGSLLTLAWTFFVPLLYQGDDLGA